MVRRRKAPPRTMRPRTEPLAILRDAAKTPLLRMRTESKRISLPLTLILHIIAKESSQIASRLAPNARDILTYVHPGRSECVPFATPRTRIEKIDPRPKKVVAMGVQRTYLRSCPISHVPVVVCQSVGIRTRGRTAAKGRRSRGSLAAFCARPASLSRDAVEGDFALCNRDWQPEANRRTPLSTGDAT